MPYILVVDDDEILTLTLEAFLQPAKIDVITAFNAEEAMGAVSSLSPNLILLDMNMPDVSGLELLAEIRKNPTNQNIPVLAISTASNQAKLDMAIQNGAHSYMHKPISAEKLRTTVKAILARQKIDA